MAIALGTWEVFFFFKVHLLCGTCFAGWNETNRLLLWRTSPIARNNMRCGRICQHLHPHEGFPTLSAQGQRFLVAAIYAHQEFLIHIHFFCRNLPTGNTNPSPATEKSGDPFSPLRPQNVPWHPGYPPSAEKNALTVHTDFGHLPHAGPALQAGATYLINTIMIADDQMLDAVQLFEQAINGLRWAHGEIPQVIDHITGAYYAVPGVHQRTVHLCAVPEGMLPARTLTMLDDIVMPEMTVAGKKGAHIHS
ncbi:MAG: hypothetical protein PHG39_06735 [Acidithiobacillus ferrooxidans]|nr:hypothetical protein [Acidithiobacillus ferrooxidans]MDD5003498.1 hypothetical protein [Acidithiobacillus sp.]MDD5378371.1 hypothetical protein [Acidithiobacillus sp.]MDD5576266.1 hypothetical protein [Acidithiobacillus sp.]